MVWRAVCTRPGNVFTATFWFAITSDSDFMESSCRLQSELRDAFWVPLHLAVSFPSVRPIVCSPDRKGHDDLTSSLPSSSLSLAVSFEFPALPAGNKGQGLRSLRDLTQHLTTRADDSHAAPVCKFPKAPSPFSEVLTMSRSGKVLRVASN